MSPNYVLLFASCLLKCASFIEDLKSTKILSHRFFLETGPLLVRLGGMRRWRSAADTHGTTSRQLLLHISPITSLPTVPVDLWVGVSCILRVMVVFAIIRTQRGHARCAARRCCRTGAALRTTRVLCGKCIVEKQSGERILVSLLKHYLHT